MCAHTHCTYGTCGVLHCLLFCDQTRPNLRISLVGYHCAIEFPCGVPLFYCCKYPHNLWRTRSHMSRTCLRLSLTWFSSRHMSGFCRTFGRVIPVVISQYIMEKGLKDRSIVTGNHQHWSLQICSIRSLLPTWSVPARLVSYLHPIKDNDSMLLAYHSRDTLCWRSDVTLRGSWC